MDKKGYTNLNIAREVKKFDKPGDAIEGEFLGVSKITVEDREVDCMDIRDENDQIWLVPMSSSLSRVPGLATLGATLYIEYKGKQKTKRGREMKVFEALSKDE